MDMVELASTKVPDDAIVLLYPVHGGYYYNFRYLITSPYLQHHIRYDTWENFVADIDSMNVRYAICNEAVLIHNALPIYATSGNEQAFLKRLVTERGEKLGVAQGDAL